MNREPIWEFVRETLIARAKPHPLPVNVSSSKSAEWFTPPKYIEAARTVMGGIDLDPASCEQANEIVRATRFFTAEQDGLCQLWHGRVWLNPPYNKSGIQGKFISKLVAEYETGSVIEAIVLVGNRTECKWFAPLWTYPLCFTKERIKFIKPNGEIKKGPVNGNVFAYLGSNLDRFYEIFSPFGEIVVRMKPRGGQLSMFSRSA